MKNKRVLLVNYELQAIERATKAVELTFEPSFTKTHDIHQIILSLPNKIKEGLMELWRQVPSVIHEYTQIMYKGLNQNFGMLTINIFFSKKYIL